MVSVAVSRRRLVRKEAPIVEGGGVVGGRPVT